LSKLTSRLSTDGTRSIRTSSCRGMAHTGGIFFPNPGT
jgi:hypothetical protein